MLAILQQHVNEHAQKKTKWQSTKINIQYINF